jgi:two-component system sensor histidine kinase KdpD
MTGTSGFATSDIARSIGALTAVGAVTLAFTVGLNVSNAATASVTYLLLVLLVAATSRLGIAVMTSVAAMLCLNFFFLPPVGTLTIAEGRRRAPPSCADWR